MNEMHESTLRSHFAGHLINGYAPSISMVIPTRNSEKTLERCLRSIVEQNYPRDRMEVLIVDAYSLDKTVELAKCFDAKILFNPRITGEAGKAVGAEAAKGELIAFVDSDNVLGSGDWLVKMVKPLQDDGQIVASEPIYYGYSLKEPIIIRYCSLIGADDPLSVYLGFYGRFSFLKGKWTDIPIKVDNRGSYFQVILDKEIVPTMGANGFLVRASALRRTNFKPFLFDLDIIYELVGLGYNSFARVKTNVFHLYAFSLGQYLKKTYRRVRDYYHYHRLEMRKYPWSQFNKLGLLKLVLSVLLILPLSKDSVKGYKRKPDFAWFLHWPLCFLTSAVYGIKELTSGFYLLRRPRCSSPSRSRQSC
jgi:glycosyltransferase involved in cell wall biosynthesis